MSTFVEEWKVEMTKQELEFVDFLAEHVKDQFDGNGDFIAPVRGGVVFLKDYYHKYNEDQINWLLFMEFQKLKYRIPGFVGLKLVNGSWHGIIPTPKIDSDAEMRYGMKRMTTDGIPLDDITGLPIHKLVREQTHHVIYEWNAEKKEYEQVDRILKYESYLNHNEKPLHSFDLYKQKPEVGE